MKQIRSDKGKAAADALQRETAKEERKVEAKTGTDFPKGEKRLMERSKSADRGMPVEKRK